MIAAKIDVTRINKADLFKGQKGTYLDLVLMENKDGPDQYGNDGMVVQGISKEKRDAGEKGPILGNYKVLGAKPKQASQPKQANQTTQDDSDIPF